MVITLLFTLMSEMCTPQINDAASTTEKNQILEAVDIIAEIKEAAEEPSEACIAALLSKISQ